MTSPDNYTRIEITPRGFIAVCDRLNLEGQSYYLHHTGGETWRFEVDGGHFGELELRLGYRFEPNEWARRTLFADDDDNQWKRFTDVVDALASKGEVLFMTRLGDGSWQLELSQGRVVGASRIADTLTSNRLTVHLYAESMSNLFTFSDRSADNDSPSTRP
jgi:hypothetical protein